jgi:hypothetical protein
MRTVGPGHQADFKARELAPWRRWQAVEKQPARRARDGSLADQSPQVIDWREC